MTQQELYCSIQQNEALAIHSNSIMSIAKPSLRAHLSKVNGNLACGVSKIGGVPDLPITFNWPLNDSEPLTFIAQIQFSELISFNVSNMLPKEGLLFFFYNYNLEDDNKASSKVLYYDGPLSSLSQQKVSEYISSAFEVFPEALISWNEAWTLPPLEEIDGVEEFPSILPIVRLLKTLQERQAYMALRKRSFNHQLFGHADAVQTGEIRFNTVMSRNIQKYSEYDEYATDQEELVQDLIQEMNDLVLLYQCPTDDIFINWPGAGVVYFWIKQQDLLRRNFQNVFTCFQHT